MALQAALGHGQANETFRTSSIQLDFQAVSLQYITTFGVDYKLFGTRLPELQGELDRLLGQVNDDISGLPDPPSSEPVVEIMKRIGTFIRSIEHIVAGAPDEHGLLQALNKPRDQFKRAIRQTAPDFRPFEQPRDVNSAPVLPEPSFLSNEEAELDWQPIDGGEIIFVDEVMDRATL